MQDPNESLREAAHTLLASCSIPGGVVKPRHPPETAAALLQHWDGRPGGLPIFLCRQHVAQVF